MGMLSVKLVRIKWCISFSVTCTATLVKYPNSNVDVVGYTGPHLGSTATPHFSGERARGSAFCVVGYTGPNFGLVVTIVVYFTKTPPDFHGQGVTRITLVYATETPPDFHERGVIQITTVYATKTPPDFHGQGVIRITRRWIHWFEFRFGGHNNLCTLRKHRWISTNRA